MKKILCMLFAVYLLIMCAGSVMAESISDTILVRPWQGSSPYMSSPWNSWTDVIGDSNAFNTSGANFSESNMTIYTNWNPKKDGLVSSLVKTADLFIDTNRDGVWDSAIQLDTLTGTGYVYANPTFKTSVDIFQSTNLIYGGSYNEAAAAATPVVATGSSNQSTTVTWTISPNGFNNEVSVDLSFLSLTSSDYYFAWGTATCSNDAISNIPVPEPATSLSLGFVLITLALAKRYFA